MLLVKVASFRNESGSDQDLQVRVHGATSDYVWTTIGGSQTSSASAWPLGVSESDGWGVGGTLRLYEGSNDDFNKFLKMSWDGRREFGNMPAAQGKIQPGGADTELDSVTFRGSTGAISLEARAFEWSA
jgi:hypothetical protein